MKPNLGTERDAKWRPNGGAFSSSYSMSKSPSADTGRSNPRRPLSARRPIGNGTVEHSCASLGCARQRATLLLCSGAARPVPSAKIATLAQLPQGVRKRVARAKRCGRFPRPKEPCHTTAKKNVSTPTSALKGIGTFGRSVAAQLFALFPGLASCSGENSPNDEPVTANGSVGGVGYRWRVSGATQRDGHHRCCRN